jgi:hypothetical protein
MSCKSAGEKACFDAATRGCHAARVVDTVSARRQVGLSFTAYGNKDGEPSIWGESL